MADDAATEKSGFFNNVLDMLTQSDMLDEFMCVSVPKRLIIQNRRIGIFYRMLQFAFAGVLIFYCFVSKAWQAYDTPTGSALVTWCPLDDHKFGSNDSSSASHARHCTQPEAYHYQSPDFQFDFRPKSCQRLGSHDSCHESGNHLFLPTVIQDTNVWQGVGMACGSHNRSWCKGRSDAARYVEAAGRCSCTVENQYFTESPETQQVFILHGYEVDLRSGHRDRVVRGSADGRSYTEKRDGKIEVKNGELITTVRSPTGQACTIGGRSEWKHTDAVHGIGGALEEWLACAGVDLEMDPKALKPSAHYPGHLRTMGLTLLLSLHYENADLDEFHVVHCTVTVDADITWTRRSRVDSTALPTPSNGAEEAFRKRLAYGVAVKLQVGGRMHTYNIGKLVSFLVESMVIMQLPLCVAQFMALYCMGIISEIYRSAKRTRLNIFEHFHSALSRMMLAEIGFRGLVGGKFEGSVSELSLTKAGLFHHITDVFAQQIDSGVLQLDEVKKMVAIVFRQLDTNGEGTITCDEFINSALAGEHITVDTMARFFDDDASVGFVRKSFDSSYQHRCRSFSDVEMCMKTGRMSVAMRQSVISSLEDDGDDSSNGNELDAQQGRYTMRECHGRTSCGDALDPQQATVEWCQDGGWEKRLSAIEGRLKKLESTDVDRFAIQLGRDDSTNLEGFSTAGSVAGTVTTETAATNVMQRENKIAVEIMTELQEDAEMRSSQLMDMLHRESEAHAKEQSEQIRLELEDWQTRYDATLHEISLRCQILESHWNSLPHPASSSPIHASPRGEPTQPQTMHQRLRSSWSNGVSSQQKMHKCLRSSLAPVRGRSQSLPASSWQQQVLACGGTDELSSRNDRKDSILGPSSTFFASI